MQSHLPQNFDFTDHFDALKECMPFMDQVIDTDFSLDFSQTNQSPIFLILQKCLTELKEHKNTIASQEDILQSATEKLISLREENSHMHDTNNNLLSQVDGLKKFLDEADLLATGLRLEINQLRNENYVLKDNYRGHEFPSETNSLKSLLTAEVIVEKEEGPLSEILLDKSIEQIPSMETFQQKENIIRELTQNVQDLSEYKEKYHRLLQESDNYKLMEEQNKRLNEELLVLREENKKLLTRSPGDIFKRIKSMETDVDVVRKSPNIKDEDCKNKNYLTIKGFSIASPSKENVDIKKGNLLMETILLNSAKRSSPPLKKNANQRLKNQILPPLIPNRRVKDLSFANILGKNNNIESSLVEGMSKEESESEESEIRQVKTEKELISSLRMLGESQISRRDKSFPSARKIEDRGSYRESPFDGNTSKASDDHCFEEMLSWEEGDFPRLNCSGMVCTSPKMESNLNFNQEMGKEKQGLIRVQQDNQIGVDDENKKDMSMNKTTSEDSHKVCEQITNMQKILEADVVPKSSRIQRSVKESTTQTEVESESIKRVEHIKVNMANTKAAKVDWSGFASIVSLVFSLIIISFFTKTSQLDL